MTEKRKKSDTLQRIFNASEEQLREWESYGDSIQADQALKEVLEEQVLEALHNAPIVKIPVFHSGGPVAQCYRPAASSSECLHEDSVHCQFMEEGTVQIQLRLPDSRPVSHAEICLVNRDDKEARISVEIVQDEEELFASCGTLDELRQKMIQAQRALGVGVDDPVDMNLEVYRKE